MNNLSASQFGDLGGLLSTPMTPPAPKAPSHNTSTPATRIKPSANSGAVEGGAAEGAAAGEGAELALLAL